MIYREKTEYIEEKKRAHEEEELKRMFWKKREREKGDAKRVKRQEQENDKRRTLKEGVILLIRVAYSLFSFFFKSIPFSSFSLKAFLSALLLLHIPLFKPNDSYVVGTTG